MIAIQRIFYRYPGQTQAVLDNVSLTVGKGETVALLGGSGSGKSTLLKCILRLMEPEAGRITLDGEDIASIPAVRHRRWLGTVFQGSRLFPNMTVRENAALTLCINGMPRAQAMARANELLELVHLDPAQFGNRYPQELSGGQQQRVGVARALAAEPKMLLMDEPFGALDAITRRALQEEIIELRERLGMSILFITHDVMEACLLGHRIAVMGEGRILQCAPVRDLLESPADPTVTGLVARPLNHMRRAAWGQP